MIATFPHYLLMCEARAEQRGLDVQNGRWRFSLTQIEGGRMFVAEDEESGLHGERLGLLALVRGLEALEQPSRVSIVGTSRYIRHGLSYGLDEWRLHDWKWERHGKMVPINNLDLWQRIDRALQIHQIEIRTLRFEAAILPNDRKLGDRNFDDCEPDDHRPIVREDADNFGQRRLMALAQ